MAKRGPPKGTPKTQAHKDAISRGMTPEVRARISAGVTRSKTGMKYKKRDQLDAKIAELTKWKHPNSKSI